MCTRRFAILVAVMAAIPGCSSIAKGVTEAILKSGEEKDERACHIEGPSSQGLEALLRAQESDRAAGRSMRTMKVLMVHGTGEHIPGYSGRLTANLMGELKLDLREERAKEIVLRDPNVWDGSLGSLRISRFMNKARTRKLLFYELTWSDITESEKEAIEFDTSKEYAFRRTGLNNMMKEFINSHIPDPLIYLGEAQIPIQTSVRQSFCWMTQGDWDDYAPFTERVCDLLSRARLKQLREDDYAFITHSLGSRIVIDMAQDLGDLFSKRKSSVFVEMQKVLREKDLPIYMMANQLPLLELGRTPAEVRGQIGAYCRAGGKLYDQRVVGQLSIYAFSDPNDILSYPIPPKFADEYMDSRLCPRITNITLNVAKPISLLGLGEFADPLEAHGGYDNDQRVIALMVHGIGHETQGQIVEQRCTWLETINR